MLQRLYVHNFRCLENFEFKPGDASSTLLIGKNGAGKSTIQSALKVFQSVGRGVNRVGQLLKPADRTLGRDGLPVRFELEAEVAGHQFTFSLALEWPDGFREFRVADERLVVDGQPLYSREQAQVTLWKDGQATETRFAMDWHLVALTVIQDPVAAGMVGLFRDWMANMVLLAPVPALIGSEARGESLEPAQHASNLPEWLAGLLAQYPAAYTTIHAYLQEVMPDLADFQFERAGKESKTLTVRFKTGAAQHRQDFELLSDGEKCFFICAVVLAANQYTGPLFTFWDEPDNYLSLSEVSHFIMALRRGFQGRSQIWMTSHNEEAIRRFARDNTWVLGRKNHLEPTLLRRLDELPENEDLIQSLLCGEVDL